MGAIGPQASKDMLRQRRAGEGDPIEIPTPAAY